MVAVALAFIFGLVFSPVGAVVFEMLPANSRTRRATRRVQNWLANRSAKKLQKRIAGLESYRANLVSDKAHYLSTLRFVLAILTLMSAALVLFIAGRIELFGRTFARPGSFDLLALMCLFVAIFFGGYALKIASLDTQDKLQATIAGIDADIQELTSKLPPT